MVGIVVRVLVLVALVAVGAIFFIRRRHARTAGVLQMAQPWEGRVSDDSIAVEKEREEMEARAKVFGVQCASGAVGR